MKVAIYCRISKDRSGLSANTGIQLQECREYAAEQGWEVVAEYEENDISASRYSTKPRPKYEQLLGMIEGGEVDVLLATEGERLHRRADEMSTLIDLAEKHPLRIALTNDDGYDLTDGNGIYRARTAVALSERESRKLSERQRRKKSAQAREGKPGGGRRPYGYENDGITIKADEAEVLREMASRVLIGHGYNEISNWLNDQGYVTTTGKLFYGVTVCNLLKKKRYAGIRVHHDAEYPALWEPVFDVPTWERLQLAIKLRSEKNVPKARKYLLTGLLECGRCGGRMHGSKRRDRPGGVERRIYHCSECRRMRRNADALDWFIRELIIYRLDSPDMAELLQPGDDGELRILLGERSDRQARLNSLVDDYASGLLDREQFARAKATAEQSLAESVAKLDKLTREATGIQLSPGDTIRNAWLNSQSTEWRRDIVELLIKGIIVLPSQTKPLVDVDGVMMRFSSDDLEISWRH